MTKDELNERLTQSMNGNPQTRPDERRQYLGSLRERVALAITNEQLKDPKTLPSCQQALAKYTAADGYKLLLNGKLDVTLLAPYMQLARRVNLPFTSINDDSAHLEPDAYGLLVVNQAAINHADIALPTAPAAPERKHSFFDFLN
ncbi:DUF1694 domain-containing protein [Lacticaseibacillus jixiensis]|uniref:DUF1694 domain-containing protein n=1 Tax=Lacticaseibacillus jixiensis TaxID=3231926 RepID=UPI0036F2FEFB